MSFKQPKPVLPVVLAILISGLFVISCNNSAEEKKPEGDTATQIAPPPPPADTLKVDTLKVDTTKMDTAATKPVKTTS